MPSESSGRPRILVAGSFRRPISKEIRDACYSLGSVLGSRYELLISSPDETTADYLIARGALDYPDSIVTATWPIEEVPSPTIPERWTNGDGDRDGEFRRAFRENRFRIESMVLPRDQLRRVQVNRADIVLIIGGSRGTRAIEGLAKSKPLVAIPAFKGTAARVYEERKPRVKRLPADDRHAIEQWTVDAVEAVIRWIDFELAELRDARSSESESPTESEVIPTATDERPARFGRRLRLSREATNDEAALKSEQYAAAVAKLFQAVESTERFCFGLFGHWGRGKTYLMKWVGAFLEKAGYKVVRFSAWKFRATPEVWAHVYESVFRAATESNRLFALRLNIIRHGMWPAVWAAMFIWLATLDVVQRARVALWVFSVLGLGFTLYLALLYMRVKPEFVKLYQLYMFAPRHTDKLGLQYSIGEDFKSLVMAFVPDGTSQGFRKPGFFGFRPFTNPWWDWKKIAAWAAFALIFISTGWVLFNSIVDHSGWLGWGRFLFGLFWFPLLIVAACLPVWAMDWPPEQPNKLLLVVDDLDRCPPDQMLEIVECLQLFLDDDDIASRMQLAMLIEDEVLEDALLTKYKRRNPEFRKVRPEQIVTENIEKIFLAHLRLNPVPSAELRELMARHCRNRVAPSVLDPENELEPTGGLGIPPGPSVEAISAYAEAMDGGPSSQNSGSDSEGIDVELTREEAQLLEAAVDRFSADNFSGRWGPRSVRKFVLRYQLARMLLDQMGVRCQPRQLIDELLRPRSLESITRAPSDITIQEVVRQVE